jgi:midasin
MEAIATTVALQLGLDLDRHGEILKGRASQFFVEKDVNGRVVAICAGPVRLLAVLDDSNVAPSNSRHFVMHRPAVLLVSRIVTALSLGEPVLLTGETATGKTSVVAHLASLLNRHLVSLNLSHQTESSDLIGGFKPVDARIPGSSLQEQFLELFSATFSRRKNSVFEESLRKSVLEGRWKRAVGIWREAARLAKERLRARRDEAEG